MLPVPMEGQHMRPYSQDLRERVLGSLERGDSPTSIAARFEVSRVWVYQVRNRLMREGKRTSTQIGGHRRSLLAPFEAEVRSWIAEQPDITLAQMCERLAADHNVTLKAPALWHQLDKWGLSYKKNSARQRAREARGATGSAGLEGKPSFARHQKARVS
jgi:transposase